MYLLFLEISCEENCGTMRHCSDCRGGISVLSRFIRICFVVICFLISAVAPCGAILNQIDVHSCFFHHMFSIVFPVFLIFSPFFSVLFSCVLPNFCHCFFPSFSPVFFPPFFPRSFLSFLQHCPFSTIVCPVFPLLSSLFPPPVFPLCSCLLSPLCLPLSFPLCSLWFLPYFRVMFFLIAPCMFLSMLFSSLCSSLRCFLRHSVLPSLFFALLSNLIVIQHQ